MTRRSWCTTTLRAAGSGGQRLDVSPSRRVVVVRFSEDETFDGATFLARLLDDA